MQMFTCKKFCYFEKTDSKLLRTVLQESGNGGTYQVQHQNFGYSVNRNSWSGRDRQNRYNRFSVYILLVWFVKIC